MVRKIKRPPGAVNLSRQFPRLETRRVFNSDLLEKARPNELLIMGAKRSEAEPASYLQDSDTVPHPHLSLCRMFIGEVFRRFLPKGTEPRHLAVLGSGECSSFPIHDILNQDYVYAIDLLPAFSKQTMATLYPRQKEKLIPVQIDASLFASALIEKIIGLLRQVAAGTITIDQLDGSNPCLCQPGAWPAATAF